TDAAGHVLGAAGASGGTGDEDEEVIIAGIAAAGLRHA
ncbi:MAG: heme-binding protein, partial [Polaromonas sp.]